MGFERNRGTNFAIRSEFWCPLALLPCERATFVRLWFLGLVQSLCGAIRCAWQWFLALGSHVDCPFMFLVKKPDPNSWIAGRLPAEHSKKVSKKVRKQTFGRSHSCCCAYCSVLSLIPREFFGSEPCLSMGRRSISSINIRITVLDGVNRVVALALWLARSS